MRTSIEALEHTGRKWTQSILETRNLANATELETARQLVRSAWERLSSKEDQTYIISFAGKNYTPGGCPPGYSYIRRKIVRERLPGTNLP